MAAAAAKPGCCPSSIQGRMGREGCTMPAGHAGLHFNAFTYRWWA